MAAIDKNEGGIYNDKNNVKAALLEALVKFPSDVQGRVLQAIASKRIINDFIKLKILAEAPADKSKAYYYFKNVPASVQTIFDSVPKTKLVNGVTKPIEVTSDPTYGYMLRDEVFKNNKASAIDTSFLDRFKGNAK